MAHRLYIYNVSLDQDFYDESLVGEWNYVIPLFFLPLFAHPLAKSELKQFGFKSSKDLFFNVKEALPLFEKFHLWIQQQVDLIPATDQAKYLQSYERQLYYFQNLPYDYFRLDGTDVYNMNEESHKKQAQAFSAEIALFTEELANIIDLELDSEHINRGVIGQSYFPFSTFEEYLNNDNANFGWDWLEIAFEKDYDCLQYEENELYGLTTFDNKKITEAVYGYIGEFTEANLAIIQRDELFGFIDKTGVEVVKPLYFDVGTAQIEYFFDEQDNEDTSRMLTVAAVCQDGKWGLLNLLSHTYLIPLAYELVEFLYPYYYNVYNGSHYAVYNFAGEQLIPFKGDSPFEYHYTYFCTSMGSKRDFYSRSHHYLGKFAYEDVRNSDIENHLLIPSEVNSKLHNLITFDGELVLESIKHVQYVTNECVIVYTDKLKGIYNHLKAKYVLEPMNCKIDTYIDYWMNLGAGQCHVSHGKKKGIFDAIEERWIVPFTTIDVVKILTNGFAATKLKDKWALRLISLPDQEFVYEYDFITMHNLEQDIDTIVLYKDNAVFTCNNHEIQTISTHHLLLLAGKLRYDSNGEVGLFNPYFNEKTQVLTAEDYAQLEPYQLNAVKDYYADHSFDEQYEALLLMAEAVNNSELLQELGYRYLTEDDYIDYNKAKHLFELAATHNNPYSVTNLGYMYEHGFGVEQDIHKAIEYYTQGAELGNNTSYNNLALIYYYGATGLDNDFNSAIHYFKKVNTKEYEVCNYLADCYYLLGEYKNAMKYIKEDMKNNDNIGSFLLGRMYCYGYGVKQDGKKAIPLLEKALQQAYDIAILDLIDIYAKDEENKDPEKLAYYIALAKEKEVELPEEYKEKSFLKKTLGKWFK